MLRKVLFAVGLVLAAIALLFWGGFNLASNTAERYMGPDTENEIGQVVPSFELPDQDGNMVQVPDGIKGKALYLVFFSTG